MGSIQVTDAQKNVETDQWKSLITTAFIDGMFLNIAHGNFLIIHLFLNFMPQKEQGPFLLNEGVTSTMYDKSEGAETCRSLKANMSHSAAKKYRSLKLF